MSTESEDKQSRRKEKYFCAGYLVAERHACLHTQKNNDACENCGSKRMYPVNLYPVASATDSARNAAWVGDDGAVTDRTHETHEAILEELKRLNDRMERLEKATFHDDAKELDGIN
jgi:hypothetical protein